MSAVDLHRPHSSAFASSWRDLVCRTFGWNRRGPFVEVPSLIRGPATASYLPLLNYADVTDAGAEALVEEAAGAPHIVRTIAASSARRPPPAKGDMVAMRLPLAGDVWTAKLRDVCRNQVRKADKSPLVLERGRSPALIADFYALYARTMHGYGMPIFPRALLELAARPGAVDIEVFLARLGEEAAAGLVLVRDGGLAWVPWGASERRHLKHCPNHLIYWRAIEAAREAGCDLFDFGRSPYGEATFDFKKKWGAEPVPLVYLRPGAADPYSRYALAQAMWRRAPAPLVDRIGPRLCRYLAEL